MSLSLYVGCYASGSEPAVRAFRFCNSSGSLSPLAGKDTICGSDLENPSYIAFEPESRVLHAVSETSHGSLSSIRLASDGSFAAAPSALLSTRGADPCHLAMFQTPAGRRVIVSNYSGGSVAVFGTSPDSGAVDKLLGFRQHAGASKVNAERQEAPHVHSCTVDPTGRFGIVCDLGADELSVYRLNESGELGDPEAVVKTAAGAGPRHLAFAALPATASSRAGGDSGSAGVGGTMAYVIHELDNTIVGYRWGGDGAAGAATLLGPAVTRVSTLPPGWSAPAGVAADGTAQEARESFCADIHVHPSGRWLYGSNRGHNSVVCCAIDPADGSLTVLGWHDCGGNWPRNFAIDPSGRFLLVANQRSGSVVVLSIDRESGLLTPTGHELTDEWKPVCIAFGKELP